MIPILKQELRFFLRHVDDLDDRNSLFSNYLVSVIKILTKLVNLGLSFSNICDLIWWFNCRLLAQNQLELAAPSEDSIESARELLLTVSDSVDDSASIPELISPSDSDSESQVVPTFSSLPSKFAFPKVNVFTRHDSTSNETSSCLTMAVYPKESSAPGEDIFSILPTEPSITNDSTGLVYSAHQGGKNHTRAGNNSQSNKRRKTMGDSEIFQFVVDTGCNLVVVADRHLMNKTHSQRIAVSGAHGTTSSCLLYTSPSPRDVEESRMPSSA